MKPKLKVGSFIQLRNPSTRGIAWWQIEYITKNNFIFAKHTKEPKFISNVSLSQIIDAAV